MANPFPFYARHAAACCFACGGPLAGNARPGGYPAGKWVDDCPRCEVATWYECPEQPAPVIVEEDAGVARLRAHVGDEEADALKAKLRRDFQNPPPDDWDDMPF